MEELILKCAEFGILGVIVLLLLTKGAASLTELTKTTATLSDSIAKLADKIADMGTLINNVTFQIAGIEKRLDKLEENSVRNFCELRELIKGKHDRKE